MLVASPEPVEKATLTTSGTAIHESRTNFKTSFKNAPPAKQAAATKSKPDSQSAVTEVKRCVLKRPRRDWGSQATGWRGRELLWLWLGLGGLVGGTCRRRRGRIDLRRVDLLGGL
jgi:hypothetical protein